MKQNYFFKTLLLLLCLVGGVNVSWATETAIPLTLETYLTTSTSETTGTINNNDGGNLGGIYKDATATFTLTNESAQDMVLTFLTATNNASSNPQVTVTMNDGNGDVFTKTVDIESTGNWTPSTLHVFDLGSVPAGTYTLSFAFTNTSSYVCNLGSIGLYNKTAYVNTMDALPGNIDLAKGTYNGPRLENSNTNVGYIQSRGTAKYQFYNNTEGGYDLKLDIYRYNIGGTMNVKIVDLSTGEEDYNNDYTIASDAPASYTTNTISISKIKSGFKTMTFTFSEGSSYICNYKDVTFEYKGVTAEVSEYTIEDQAITAGTETDYLCNLPVMYDATTTFAISATNGTIAVTAKGSDDSSVTVTDNGNGTYTIPTPGLNDYSIVTTTLTPNEGAAATKTTYTLKLFRIGEMSLTDVKVDGVSVDVLDGINDSSNSYSATYSSCYTTAPTVTATQIDGEAAEVSGPSISGSTYTYTIHGEIEDKDIERDYTLVLDNVHVYAVTGDEESVNIKANEGTIESNTWSNGSYTLATTSLDKYNEYFKMNGDSYTISVPADVTVKQVIMKDCSNNYAGNDARLTAVTSTEATTYIPVNNKYYHSSEGSKHDIIVNIADHAVGTDIVLTQQKKGQPMAWIQLTTVKSNPGTAPVKTDDNVTIVNNHAVVAVTFDREIANDVTASINGGTVTAEGGAATLYFPVWDLSYSTNYTLTIAAEAVEDNYGNKNSEAIEITVNVPAKPAVTQATYDYVVSNATELDDAIAALKVSNNTAAAARKTVFLKNGSYTYATLTGSYQYNVSLKIDNWNDIYNVSLIGESKDGVIIEGTTDGITSATLNLGNGTGIYLQDMTIRNNYDYPTADKGVSVAVTGGNMAVLKNVAMQACQDTYVTGKRTYLENCDISGTVDFICGGGDIFFNQCNLILLYRPEDKNDVIVAPNTTADTKWGYVFQYCTINAKEGENVLAEKNYYLGRPWQNEPRTYFLNTTLNILPFDCGWGGMESLPTHFYEYNSLDANGDAFDLSGRTNSSSSTNSYNPILTSVQADKYTVENVLGGTDSWLPTDECPTLDAPASVSMSGTTLSWDAVSDARCYVIFKDGEYYANQTETSIALTEAGTYTVKAANLNGGLGAESASKTYVILDQAVSYVASASTNTSITLTRTIAADKWSTIVLPCDLTSDQIEDAFGASVQVAELSSLSDDVLHFTSVTSMNANEPYLIKVASDFTTATINGVTIEEGTPSKTTVSGVDFVGSYASVTEIPASDGDYTYYFISKNTLYSTASSGTANKMRGTRAYFKVPGNTSARQMSFLIDDDDITTDISATLNAQGQRTNDSVVYDLQGRKVNGPRNATLSKREWAKGLYIVNGKKVLVP